MKRWLLLLGGLSGACGGGPGGDDGPGPVGEVIDLDPVKHLVRASMALRGVRPALAEIERVRADPGALPMIVDGYLDTPEFGETMRDLHNEAVLTRGFSLPVLDSLDGHTTTEMAESLGEEPLRLIEHVIMSDRPYTEIVTARFTMADEIIAKVYGVAWTPGGETWQESHYTDGRPEAGILSSNTFFIRHRSAGSNWHRGRANRIASALLCYNFLDRDVTFDGSVNLADPDAVADAVVANPACASCHQTLDPLASYLWGYRNQLNIVGLTEYPIIPFYVPGNEGRWRNSSGRPPSYFGQAGDDLGALAELIAGDPRFSLCAAQRFWSFMAQVDLEVVPLELASRLQQELIASGYSAKALAKAVVLSDEFKVAYGTSDEVADQLVGLKKVRPEQLARLIYDLTGFRWRTESIADDRGGPIGLVELAKNDVLGYRVLGGGIDSTDVVEPSHTFNATSSLFARGFAAEAAGFVVDRDFAQADAAQRKLLGLVSPTETGEAAVRAQLAWLHARLYAESVAADSAEVDDSYALFAATLARTGDPSHAWKTTHTAMLQDLRIATY